MRSLANTAEERADQLRAAMRAWTTGVAIVTAEHGGKRHGMTVSSFTSISLDPPLVVISLSMGSHTHDLVREAGAFGVTSWLRASRPSGTVRGQPQHGDRMEGLRLDLRHGSAPSKGASPS
jgi:flavin reductase (DIM6/NTAB) family NADH-FMN oxidoreductase RutF